MAVTRFSAQHRVREDVFDSITPSVTVQRDVSAPSGEWKPAPWLPIVFSKSNIGAGTDYFVISSGKIVSFDSEGYLVPAGLRAALVDTAASTAAVLTYTSDDYDQQVIDLVTGVAVASSAGATYTGLEVAEAIVERGFIDAVVDTTSGSVPPATDTDIQEVIESFISKPVGVSAYDIYVWSGRPEDGDQKFNNYSKQHLIQFLTELQMKVPHRTTQDTSSDSFDVSAVTETAAASADGDFPVAGEIWNETALDDLSRYAAVVDGMSVTAWALAERPVAKNTSRTPISCDVSGVLTTEKSSLAGISSEGDWYLDADVGILFTHSDTYDTLVADNNDPTFSYYYYEVSATTGASSDRYVFFDGEGKPGDFLSFDASSNFVVMASSQDALGTSNTEWIARLHKIDAEPKDLLDKVKTAFNLTGMTAVSKMPGSATSGYSDLITLATSEEVADQIAIINLVVR
jgi:hypothetical protein